MSTPAQYIPPEFQGDITPAMPDRSAETARYQSDLDRYTRQVSAYQSAITFNAAAAKRRGLSRTDVRRYLLRASLARKGLEAAQKNRDLYQRRVYETSGQWDKLLEGPDRDAYLALNSMFTQLGLGSLSGQIFKMVQQGYGADTIALLLQDTKEYKQRFAANEARQKAGLPVLSPAEYLSAESAYRQVLSSAGMPKGFYDNPADFINWIAGDVSPTEIKSRVDMAKEATSQANPAYKQALKQMYGVDESGIVAYFLDRKRAEPLLQKQAAAASIGAAAIQRGFAPSQYAEAFATEGISAEQAQQGYALIADTYGAMRAIADRYGMTWTQGEAERDVFEPGMQPGGQPFTGESPTEKRKRLASQERALFSGGRGSSVQGLAAGYRQT